MAIIDLRHLIEPECDVIKFIGNEDKQEYALPVKKTVGMTLIFQNYMNEFMKSKPIEQFDVADNIELGYFMITAWIRSFYPDKSVDWVKINIGEELFAQLVNIGNEKFFPKLEEPGKPRKNRKSSKS